MARAYNTRACLSSRRAVKARDSSLGLRYADMSKCFDELDADGSGALEENEIQQLFERMVSGHISQSGCALYALHI